MDPLTVEAFKQHTLDAYALIQRPTPEPFALAHTLKCCTQVPGEADAVAKEGAMRELGRLAAYFLAQQNLSPEAVDYHLTIHPIRQRDVLVTAELCSLGQESFSPAWTPF